jgi:hypothetical protein
MATQYAGGTIAGEILTAATMNSIGAAWETYVPVFKTGATTRTTTVTYARFCQIQKLITVQVELVCTEAGTANAVLSISLPTTLTYAKPTSPFATVGTFTIQDTGTAFYAGAATTNSANTIQGLATGSVDNMGASSPAMTIAVNDRVSFSVVLEAN